MGSMVHGGRGAAVSSRQARVPIVRVLLVFAFFATFVVCFVLSWQKFQREMATNNAPAQESMVASGGPEISLEWEAFTVVLESQGRLYSTLPDAQVDELLLLTEVALDALKRSDGLQSTEAVDNYLTERGFTVKEVRYTNPVDVSIT